VAATDSLPMRVLIARPVVLRRPWLFVGAVFVLSRLFYLLVGQYLSEALPPPTSRFLPPAHLSRHLALGIWAHWDGAWYIAIATRGYANHGFPTDPLAATAFFPLYPVLIRLGWLLTDEPAVVGVAISLACLLAALVFVYRVAEAGWGSRVAEAAVLCLALFPTSFYFNAVYTESLFLALSAGAVWAVRCHKRLLLGCALAGLASATRNVGVLLLVPLGYTWLSERRRYRWQGLALALVPAGLACYMAYLALQFGDPLIFQQQQAQHWERQLTSPDRVVVAALKQARAGLPEFLAPGRMLTAHNLSSSFEAGNLANLGAFVFAVVLLGLGLRRLPADLLAYTFALTIPPALFATPDQALMSLPRLVLAAFPLFIVLGTLLQRRWVLGLWLAGNVVLSVYLCALFVSWRWVA